MTHTRDAMDSLARIKEYIDPIVCNGIEEEIEKGDIYFCFEVIENFLRKIEIMEDNKLIPLL